MTFWAITKVIRTNGIEIVKQLKFPWESIINSDWNNTLGCLEKYSVQFHTKLSPNFYRICSRFRNLSNCVAETDPGSARRRRDPADERRVDRCETDRVCGLGTQTMLPVTGDAIDDDHKEI